MNHQNTKNKDGHVLLLATMKSRDMSEKLILPINLNNYTFESNIVFNQNNNDTGTFLDIRHIYFGSLYELSGDPLFKSSETMESISIDDIMNTRLYILYNNNDIKTIYLCLFLYECNQNNIQFPIYSEVLKYKIDYVIATFNYLCEFIPSFDFQMKYMNKWINNEITISHLYNNRSHEYKRERFSYFVISKCNKLMKNFYNTFQHLTINEENKILGSMEIFKHDIINNTFMQTESIKIYGIFNLNEFLSPLKNNI